MAIWNRLKQLLEWIGLLPQQVVPSEPASFRPIGVVRNWVIEPRTEGWEDVISDIIVRRELEGALDGLEGFSHLLVLCYLHRVTDEQRSRSHCFPRGDPRYPLQGIFATRTQHRPNPIGATVVHLVKRRKNVLRVTGLDAVNGTPVLDVKPYIPHYDAPSEVRLPDWITQPPASE